MPLHLLLALASSTFALGILKGARVLDSRNLAHSLYSWLMVAAFVTVLAIIFPIHWLFSFALVALTLITFALLV